MFPRNCVVTGDVVDDESPFRFISSEAASQIFKVNPPHCSTCGYPFFGVVKANDRECQKCNELQPVYNEGKTVILVEGVSRDLVHAFKYEGARYLLKDFRTLFELSPGLKEYIKDARLVPVPLHPRKERERGFNQSLELCKQLAAVEPSCKVADVLQRIVDTPSQTLFSRQERLKNLRKAFVVKKEEELNKEIRHIIVDDVFTTGSTLNSCAKPLKKAGIRCIDILTLGHG